MASELCLLPRWDADILEQDSALNFLPRLAAEILARASGLCLFPRLDADIFAKVSWLCFLPLAAADIFTMVSGLVTLLRRAVDNLVLVSGEQGRPTAPSPPDVWFVRSDPCSLCHAIQYISEASQPRPLPLSITLMEGVTPHISKDMIQCEE